MRRRSFLLGLVTGVAVLGLSVTPAKAQYTWEAGTTDPNWTLLENWNLSAFPGDTNTGSVAEGTVFDTARIGARNAAITAIGINFSNVGGTGSGGAGNAAAATGRLTLAGFGMFGGAALTIGNNAVGGAPGAFNGILQLDGGSVNFGAPTGTVANTIFGNTSGQTLTIARNVVPGNEANADMAIRINSATNVIPLNGNSTIDVQTQLVMANATDRRITVQGAGTVILGADNTQAYTATLANAGQQNYVGLQGGWTITNGATLRVASDANLGIAPGAGAVADHFQLANGTLRADAAFTLDSDRGITLTTAGQAGTLLVQNGADTLTYDGVITGAGNFAKAGAGTLLMSAVHTYGGSTAVSGGTLQLVGGDDRLPITTALNITGNATLDLTDSGGRSQTLAGLAGTAGTNINMGAGTLTVANAAAGTFSGAINGTGPLVKSGAGTLTLDGTNTYNGGTTISGGTLRIGNAGAAGSVVGAITNNADLEISRSDDISFANDVSGTGTLTKTGAGVTTLTGTNTYQGATRILAGTLAIDSDARLGTPPALTPAHLVLNGGALRATASFALDTNRGIALGPTTGSGTGTIDVAGGSTLTYGGVMDDQGGTGSFAKTGTGELVLSAAQAYAGSTTVDNGTLSLVIGSGDNRLPGTALTVGAGTNTATLNLNDNNQAVTNLTGNATGTINLGTGTLTVNPTGSQNFMGVIAGTGGLVKDGADTQVLSGANTFTGPISINAGTLTVEGDTGAIAGTAAITNAGTLLVNKNTALTLDRSISGAGVLNKQGTGVLTLTGNNTYTGDTFLSGGGVLQAGSATAFSSGSQFNLVGAATTLRLNGFNNTVGSLASAADNGVIENAAAGPATLTISSGTYGGVIQDGGAGALALVKQGAGTLVLAGNATHTGGTTVSGGVLQVGNGVGGSITGAITNNASVVFNPGTTNNTYAGDMSGTGSLTKEGANTLILSGANTFAGPITISGGTLQVGTGATGSIAGTQAISNAGTLAFNQDIAQTVSGNITGAGVLTKAGTGVLTLSGTNGYTGATTITGGVLQAGSNSAFGTNSALNINGDTSTVRLNGNPVTVGSLATSAAAATRIVENASATPATLTTGGLNTSTTFGGVIQDGGTGALALTKVGTGILTLTGANTYTGGTTISDGTVLIGAAGAIPDTGTLTLAGAGTLSTAGGAGGAGVAETAGTLRTTGSTIELGSGQHTLIFNGLDATSTSSPTITGWVGVHFFSGQEGRILFNNLTGDPNATYVSWLSGVNFVGQPLTGGHFLNVGGGQFELVPVPEPGTVLGIAAAGLVGLGLLRRRLRRGPAATVAA
jgi:autotransporter-associated beta strand protein